MHCRTEKEYREKRRSRRMQADKENLLSMVESCKKFRQQAPHSAGRMQHVMNSICRLKLQAFLLAIDSKPEGITQEFCNNTQIPLSSCLSFSPHFFQV
jgi:hypothetical protein